jgi:DNA transformation protein
MVIYEEERYIWKNYAYYLILVRLLNSSNEVGITTYEKLKEVGSKQAWLKIKSIDPSACINRLYALEGAIQGIKKSQLPTCTKEELKKFYYSFKG